MYQAGWQTWTRTTIHGVRGRCPAVGRSAKWSGREDSNLHAPAPEAGGLPITLRPEEWGERRESNPLERGSQPRGAPFAFAHQRAGSRPWSRRRESNPHFEAYETSKVAVPSLRICALVDPEGIEPSSRGCRPRILPLNDGPASSWRGQRDLNPYSRADNAASFPSTMSPSGWSARGESNPDLHGLNVPRLPIAPRAAWS